MANAEAWKNLEAMGVNLFIQRYAIDEIQSLKPKNNSTISPEEAHASILQIRKLYNLFTYIQEDINLNIDPTHRTSQLALTDRMRKKVTSYLIKFQQILSPDEPSKPIEFPVKFTSSEKLEDWIAYEEYLEQRQEIRDFNCLCWPIPNDILPAIKQLRKEGATISEIEKIVNKISSSMDFDNLIEAEVQNVENYPLLNNDDNKEEFQVFAKTAKQATRILRICNDELNTEQASWMVHRITEKFPETVKNKWRKQVHQQAGESLEVKLEHFLDKPVDVLFQEDVVGRWEWIRGVFSRIMNKFFSRFRAS